MALNPVKTSEEFLGILPKRAREVLERRFGVGKSREKKTLEAIGASYGITRERVRQIEAHALKKL
ncbi:MAG: sigma factor-like helix-turn-helix DNA-binding protein, partial [bacterium]|nr:sigma factor-like helix-turn-helix DNA-binding protein [bacterium]